MAATSGIFNFVKLTGIKYADVDTSSATKPATLKDITSAEVLDGTFTIDIPAKSTTSQYNEDGEEVYAYSAPVQKKVELGLPKSTMATVSAFLEGTLTAGTAGTTPDSFSFDGTQVKNKYMEISGINSEGEAVVVTLYNAKVTSAFTGKMGNGQALVPLTLTMNALRNAGMGKSFTISAAF